MEAGIDPDRSGFWQLLPNPFENLTFTAGTTGNVAGYSQFNWPVSQWATDLKINLTRTLAVKVGVFAFNDYWISRDYYLRIDNPGGTSGAVIPVEIAWNPKLHIFGKICRDNGTSPSTAIPTTAKLPERPKAGWVARRVYRRVYWAPD
jgi:Carbohydrate-selective porin, OprB family